jgi:hypothetical protein
MKQKSPLQTSCLAKKGEQKQPVSPDMGRDAPLVAGLSLKLKHNDTNLSCNQRLPCWKE